MNREPKIITLTTDFGTADYFVGAMKGAIWAANAELMLFNNEIVVVDITHEIAAHNIRSAAFVLFEASRIFPARSIHVAVVDPGVGSARRGIIAVADDKIYVAPDNGLLELVFQHAADLRVFHISDKLRFNNPTSETFHGRDVFAPVAAYLANGIEPDEFGNEIADFVRLEIPKPQQTNSDTIETEVLHIDRFGNCLVNLRREDLPPNFAGKFDIEVRNRKIEKLQNYYAEAGIGEIFMIFGSAELLEIVAFQASAAELLKVAVGETVLIKAV